MKNDSYMIYDEEWPENSIKFMCVVEDIARQLGIESYKIGYLEIYQSPIAYHKDQVLNKKELRELFNKIWEQKYWAYFVAHRLSFCIYEDNIRVNCALSFKTVFHIAKQHGLSVEKCQINDNHIAKYCFLQSIITPRRIRIKSINKPPLEGYGATPILLSSKAIKEYELNKVPFGCSSSDWSYYEDVGEIFNGVVLTEQMYLDKVEAMVNCLREISDSLGLKSFKLSKYKSFDDSYPPVISRKTITQNETLELLKWGLIHGGEFVIKSKNFVLYSKSGFRLGICTTLSYDAMRLISSNHQLFSTIMWKEWEQYQL